jgi:hypothetical protein
MEPLEFVITLAFFITVIALVAIVFGRWEIAELAVSALGDALKKISRKSE